MLVIAAGAVSHHFDVPGVDEHAFPLKHLDDALALRAHVLDRFERAAATGAVADGALDVVVCGGGPTGVEMAGGAARAVLARAGEGLPAAARCATARIVLVEMADRLLTPFTPKSSARARRTLERRGVEVRLGVGVDAVDADRGAAVRRDRDPGRHDGVGHGRDRRPAGGDARHADHPRRPARRRTGSVDPRAAGGVRGRRHRRLAGSGRHAAPAGRRAGDAGRPPRRPPDHAPRRGPSRPSRSGTATRARWRRSDATTRSPSWPTAGG